MRFAEEALERRDITPMQFLDQIIFNQKTKDVQAFFENLSYAEDYFIEYKDDTDDGEEGGIFQTVPAVAPDPKDALLCKVCYSRNFDCILMPCKHACCCFQCYEKWVKVDVRKYDNEILTEDEIDAFLADEPIQPPTCPLCRETIQSAVSGIKFN